MFVGLMFLWLEREPGYVAFELFNSRKRTRKNIIVRKYQSYNLTLVIVVDEERFDYLIDTSLDQNERGK